MSKTKKKFRDWHESIQEPSLTFLFALQMLTVFIIAPVNDSFAGEYRWTMDCALGLMSLVSIFIVVRPVARAATILSLALALIGIGIGPLFEQPDMTQPLSTLSGLLYTVTVSLVVMHKIFAGGSITLHRIRASVTVYLNIAILFALMDTLLLRYIPNAFSFNTPLNHDFIGTMIYFSLTTLTSTGYGDIVPVHPYARSLANLESVVGQFYLGALVATLISLHVSHRQSETRRKAAD